MATATQETNWYTIKVQNNYEKKVKDRIEMELTRGKYDCKIVIPMDRSFSVKKGKKIFKDKVKFPGYLFVETNNIAELQAIVRQTTGATKVVTSKNADGKEIPARLRHAEVVSMLLADEELQKPVAEDLFVVGEHVKIIDGPFIDFSGAIDWVDLEKSKMKVLVKIFGKATPVELSFEQVVKF
jgi:transcriptional antiterminator NusG